jgi:hypothetical protein
MKKHISNPRTAITKLFYFFSMTTILFPPAVMAQDKAGQPVVIVRNALPIDGAPVFQVQIEKDKKSFYDLSISDPEGTVFYAERIHNTVYLKRFKIDMPGTENIKLVVKITDKSGKDLQTFYIDTKTNMQYDMVVSRN